MVDAAICEVAYAVSVGENSWLKLTAPVVADVQSGTVLMAVIVVPTQNIRDSGMVPVSKICRTVAAAVVPASTAVV